MYDLVNAQYSLPFIAPVNFIKVLNSINSSLKKEGIFTGQLFGVHDEWNTENGIMTFHTHKEVEKLLSDYEIIDFKEEERDKNTAAGILKHWHVFHFIVKK